MSWFDDIFGGGGQAAAGDMSKGYQQSIDDYNNYLNRAQSQLNPYIQQGQQASNNNMAMSNEMMRQAMGMMGGGGYGGQQMQPMDRASNGINAFANNMLGPGGMQHQGQGQGGPSAQGQPGGQQGGNGTWMDNYVMSPMAKYHMQQGMAAGEGTAAASGMIGSNANQRGLMNMANDISSQDQQQYYNNMMGLMQGAQQGYQTPMDQGYGAGSALAGYDMQTGQWVGNAHQNQGMANAYGDQSRSGGIDNFLGVAGNMPWKRMFS